MFKTQDLVWCFKMVLIFKKWDGDTTLFFYYSKTEKYEHFELSNIVYICVWCIYTYIYIYIYIYIKYVHISYMHIYIYIYYIYIYTYIYIHVLYTYIYIYISAFIYTYIYAYTYLYIHGSRCSEFFHWTLWRTLMRTGYFLILHHTTNILANLVLWVLCWHQLFSTRQLQPHWKSWEGRNTS